jgi:hypothetical protein
MIPSVIPTALGDRERRQCGRITAVPAGEVMVASGRVFLSEANTEDVNASLAGQPYPASGTTNVFYASFTVKFTSLPASGGTYFAHFKNSSGHFSGAHLGADRRAPPPQIPAGNFLDQRLRPSAPRIPICRLNTDYTIVTRLVNSNSVSTLWINPASESDASISVTSESVGVYRGQLCAP